MKKNIIIIFIMIVFLQFVGLLELSVGAFHAYKIYKIHKNATAQDNKNQQNNGFNIKTFNKQKK